MIFLSSIIMDSKAFIEECLQQSTTTLEEVKNFYREKNDQLRVLIANLKDDIKKININTTPAECKFCDKPHFTNFICFRCLYAYYDITEINFKDKTVKLNTIANSIHVQRTIDEIYTCGNFDPNKYIHFHDSMSYIFKLVVYAIQEGTNYPVRNIIY